MLFCHIDARGRFSRLGGDLDTLASCGKLPIWQPKPIRNTGITSANGEHRGLLQSQLGALVGAPASVISRYETGDRRIHLEMQFKLMRALNIAPAQFFCAPGAASLDDLASGATDEQRTQIGKMAKVILRLDEGG
jgi:Helix-turn-helix